MDLRDLLIGPTQKNGDKNWLLNFLFWLQINRWIGEWSGPTTTGWSCTIFTSCPMHVGDYWGFATTTAAFIICTHDNDDGQHRCCTCGKASGCATKTGSQIVAKCSQQPGPWHSASSVASSSGHSSTSSAQWSPKAAHSSATRRGGGRDDEQQQQ